MKIVVYSDPAHKNVIASNSFGLLFPECRSQQYQNGDNFQSAK